MRLNQLKSQMNLVNLILWKSKIFNVDTLNIFDFHFDKEDLAQMDSLDDVSGRTGANPLTADF
jgi:hypothetical protein